MAASNDDLALLVRKGAFREDLLYRLNTVLLVLPPLRERGEDIPLLVEFFAARAARRHGKVAEDVLAGGSPGPAKMPFPGNVRELEHLVEMLTLLVDGETVTPDDLPAASRRRRPRTGGRARPSRKRSRGSRRTFSRAGSRGPEA